MSHEPRRCTDSVNRRAREEDLALLAGGDLPPEEAAPLEEHAERCPACRATLAGLRESRSGVALLAVEDLGPARPDERAALERVRAGVLAGVARIEGERPAGPLGDAGAAEEAQSRRFRWALAAVLLVALLGATLWLRSAVAPEPAGTPPERFAQRPAPAEPRYGAAPPPGPSTADAPARPEAADRPALPDLPDEPERPDRLARSPAVPEDEPIAADPPAVPSEPIEPNDPYRSAPSDPSAQLAEDRPAEPRITIRIVSDDPDIVFYWLVEPEENRDETASS